MDEIRYLEGLTLTGEGNRLKVSEQDSIHKMGQHCEGRYKIIKPEYIIHDEYILTCNRPIVNQKDTANPGTNLINSEDILKGYENTKYTFWLEVRYSHFQIMFDENSAKGDYHFTFYALTNKGNKLSDTATITHK